MANSWSSGNRPLVASPLRLWLALRFTLAGMAPLLLVAALILWILLPQALQDIETRHQALARAIAGQIEAHLRGAGRELAGLAAYFREQGRQTASFWNQPLDAHSGTGEVFAAIYIADADDSVFAVGLPTGQRGQRGDLLQIDLSKWNVLREARERREPVWSEVFLSAVSARLVVSLAIPVGEQVVIGEVAIDGLSEFVSHLLTESAMTTMILDRRGQIIAHSQWRGGGQQLNLARLPIVDAALRGRFTTQDVDLEGKIAIGTLVGVPEIGWMVLVAQPRAAALKPLLSTLWALAAGALVALLLAAIATLLLARAFASRIGRYAAQAHAIAEGDYDQPWPVSNIRELDSLAEDLDRMSQAIRQREQKLATNEARFRSVITNAPVVIYQLDRQGVFTMSEGKGLAGLGLQPGEVVGQSVFELYRDDPEVCDQIRRAIEGSVQYTSSCVRDTYFDTYYSSVPGTDGTPELLGLAVDISERVRAEEELRQANLVVENSLAMLFRWKAEEGWPVVFVSHNVKQLGYSAEELLNGSTRFASILYPDDLERIVQEVRSYSESGLDHFQQEYRIITKDGAIRWVDDRTVVERNAKGQISHYQGIVIDITDRKRAEEELQQYREHLEELVAARTAELRQAMTQLVQAEKLAALGHLVAGVAHELNTPLGNVRTVASALGEHLDEFATAVDSGALRRSQMQAFLNRGREAVDLLERNAARAADLIGHFKQVAVDQTSVRRRRFDLRQTMEQMLATLQPQFKRTTHRIELDIPSGLELDSYPGPLEQVFTNLVSNSLVHGFAGIQAGVIRLSAMPLDAMQIQIDYIDNGAGISKKILSHVFEPFFTTKLGHGGSGLGLYIVYNLVTGVLGGTIQGFSQAGQGVTFTLVIPQTAPDRPVEEPLA